MTAAHRDLPLGTLLYVSNPETGVGVVVRVNDRGPFHGDRVIDVSRAAASVLGLVGAGSGDDSIRSSISTFSNRISNSNDSNTPKGEVGAVAGCRHRRARRTRCRVILAEDSKEIASTRRVEDRDRRA